MTEVLRRRHSSSRSPFAELVSRLRNDGRLSVANRDQDAVPPLRPCLESVMDLTMSDPMKELTRLDRPFNPRLYEGLVRSVAWDIHVRSSPEVPLDDLVAYGFLGLVEAAGRFDPNLGVRFTTFAYPRIRGAVLDGRDAMRADAAVMDPDDPSTEPTFVSHDGLSPSASLASAEARARLALLIGDLPQQMRELLHLLYVSGLTMTNAGQAMGVSVSRASRLHGEALGVLSKLLHDR